MSSANYREHQPSDSHGYELNRDLTLMQERVREALDGLSTAGAAGASGLIVDSTGTAIDVSLTEGRENWVEHGLGVTVSGYRVVWQTTPAIIYVSAASTADFTKYLPLVATMDVTVRLEVF